MRNSILASVLVAFLFLIVPDCFAANLSTDWSDAVNPNGAWSYNEGNNPLQMNIPGWPLGGFGPDQSAWANSNVSGTFIPGWFKSIADSSQLTSDYPTDWRKGDVLVHSTDGNGIGHGPANVTWTSPFTGFGTISGYIWAGRDLGRSNTWDLYLNDVLLTGGAVAWGNGFSRARPDVFYFPGIGINQGDVVKLEVLTVGGDGDMVGTQLSINPMVAPEPSALLLFGPGLLGMGLILFRSRKAII